MNKQEFISALGARLSGLPEADIEERLGFYSEIIDDRIEEGLSEEEAVSGLGSVEEIALQIIGEIPFAKLAKERIKTRRRLGAWATALLILGSPIWLSLLVSAFAVIVSLYASVWAAVISLWAVFASLAGSAFGLIVGGIGFAVLGNLAVGLACIGGGLACAGLLVFMFYACKAATRWTCILAKKIAFGIKKCFVGKGDTK